MTGRLIASALLAAPAIAAAQATAPDPAMPSPAEPPPSMSDPEVQAPARPAVAPAPAPPAADPPKRLAIGKDSPGAWFVPGVLAQAWFVDDTATSANAQGADVTRSATTFRIRRAELAVSGEIIPKAVKYKVMIDPSRVRDTLVTTTAVDAAGMPVAVKTPVSALSSLQDFYITVTTDVADVSIGQFKIPVSWEGVASSAKIILPERAFVSTVFGDKRDLGLRLEKTFSKWGYMAGVWNGAGLDNFDNNNQKDGALRLEIYPVKGLTLAGVTYDSIGYRGRAGTKDRWEADLRYEAGPFLFQGEYIQARDVRAPGSSVSSQGFYAVLAYKLGHLGTGAMSGELQPVVRVAYFDPDTSQDVDPTKVAASNPGGNDERVDYEVGLNYYVRGHEMKFQGSYVRQAYDTKTPNNEVIIASQVWF